MKRTLLKLSIAGLLLLQGCAHTPPSIGLRPSAKTAPSAVIMSFEDDSCDSCANFAESEKNDIPQNYPTPHTSNYSRQKLMPHGSGTGAGDSNGKGQGDAKGAR